MPNVHFVQERINQLTTERSYVGDTITIRMSSLSRVTHTSNSHEHLSFSQIYLLWGVFIHLNQQNISRLDIPVFSMQILAFYASSV